MNKCDTRRDGVPVIIVETGERFNSIQSCANHLGVNASWLGRVVRGNDRLYTVHGYHVVRESNIYDERDYEKKEHRGRPGSKIKIVETGKKFDSISDCAKSLDGSVGSIHDAIHGNRNRKTYRGLHFELTND